MTGIIGNLRKWLEEMAGEEPIEAVVIGTVEDWYQVNIPNYDRQPKKTMLSWEKAKQWLDYDFNVGRGGKKCNPIYAWTKTWVIMVDNYDGLNSVFYVPRNPMDIEPDMPGGG